MAPAKEKDSGMVIMPREEFEGLLNCAAERGAERVLAHLGLENGHPRETFVNCVTSWKPGGTRVAPPGKPS